MSKIDSSCESFWHKEFIPTATTEGSGGRHWATAATGSPAHEPKWINFGDWIAGIGKTINSTDQSDGIRFEISTCYWIVVPEVVVIQPGLLVRVLARIAQVHGEDRAIAIRVFAGGSIAERVMIPSPDHGVVAGSSNFCWGIQVIGVDVEHTHARSTLISSYCCDRDVIEPHQFLYQIAALIVFAN